jgi:hypothetical protein
MTDGRTQKQTLKIRRKRDFRAFAGTPIGYSRFGHEIVVVPDSPESLTAFEAAAEKKS